MQPEPDNAKKNSGFIQITREMLMSEAYKNLTPSAAKALPLFLMQVKKPLSKPASYYGEVFKFPYSHAKERYGFAERTFRSVIQQLVKHGFIEQVSKGGIKGGKKCESTFRLSDKWKHLQKDNTHVQKGFDADSFKDVPVNYEPYEEAINF